MPAHVSSRSRALPAAAVGAVLVFCLLAAAPSSAQDGYRLPDPAIVDILDAPPLPFVTVDPTGRTLLLLERESMPSIADMAQPMLRLAGYRVNPLTNGPHGPRSVVGLSLQRLDDGSTVQVDLPDGASPDFPEFSPDGSRFAFTVTHDDGIELWVGETATGAARAVTPRRVNAAGASGWGGLPVFEWAPDGEGLYVSMVPADRGPMPESPLVPVGPVIQETSGRTSPVRTYQDLLQSPHDEALFDHLFTAQLVHVDLGDGRRREIGEPAILAELSPSPGGEYLLVERIRRPYSYLVPARSFPKVVEVWDTDGNVVTELASLPLADTVPIGGVPTGPRSHEWQATAEATVIWVEALDEGDPKAEVSHRDRVMALAAPFEEAPREVIETEYRHAGLRWLADSDTGLVSEYDRDERWVRGWLLDTADPDAEPRLVVDRDVQDRYGDIGDPIMRSDASGESVIHVTDGAVFLSGQGASPEGDRPFLDRMDLATLETTRLWQNEGESYETVIDLLEPDGSRILTRRETPTEPPNYWVRDLGNGAAQQITAFEDPAPELREVHKELVHYTRDDGVELSATLYLPPGYEEGRGERLPLVVWAYPLEYNDPYTAGQVRGSPHRFTTVGGASHLFYLMRGYAIMDGATMPVVGSDPETVNDTFIDQIVASAKAAIDYAAERGVADPERVGVGGHSYGAFMTANLLAHSDLFAA
ncbi:MAG: S9 family peptidase, partial [Acidobacteriota bacterium]